MKTAFLFAIIFAGSMTLASCGSHKTTTMVSPDKVKIELDECQELAQAKPAVRAWGEGVNYRLSRAASYAELQARARLARSIASAIKTAQSEEGLSYDKASTDEENGANVRDEGSKGNDLAQSIAETTVKNAVIIKTSQYQKKDGSYQVFVCLEYQDGVGKLASDVTKKVQQQVSDDDRLKMNFEFEKFRQRVEDELKKSKGE